MFLDRFVTGDRNTTWTVPVKVYFPADLDWEFNIEIYPQHTPINENSKGVKFSDSYSDTYSIGGEIFKFKLEGERD